MRATEIGAAIDGLASDVRKRARELVQQYRARRNVATLKQAIDTPHRVRAQLAAWIATYNARVGAGAAQAFLAQCLTAASSSKTLAQINTDLAAIEVQAQTVVDRVTKDGWSWDQAADAIEAALTPAIEVDFSFRALPIPDGYVTVFGDSW